MSKKFTDASRLNSLFCLCLIPKKSLAQPDCCCRPTRVEIDGIVASGCVWLSWFHMMSISTSCSSHVSFDRSGSTWTKFKTQCDLWKRKKTPDWYKFTDASRLNSLFCLCLIPKLSKSIAQPDCCCTPTRVEINGIVASGCAWLSWFHMMSIPLPALHMLLLRDLVLLEPNSKLSATYENGKKHLTHTSYLTHRD